VFEFEAAVERHQRKVYSFACYWLGDREAAADVTQEVWIRLWRHWDGVRAETMQSWLIRTTRNACIDHLRHRRVERSLFLESEAAEGLESAEQPVAEGFDPVRRLENKALGHRLAREIRHLREPHRAIVILREIQGLSYREISDALSIPINSVKVYLHRGRRALRESLKEQHVPTSP
jgi:RNA polymerase sigma-70 factor (ECF subfamily)